MDKFATLWAIGPRNLTAITLALFYITAQEIKRKHAAIALPLMEKLIEAWHGYSDRIKAGKRARAKKMLLIRAARALIAIMTPSAKKRLKDELIAS